MLTAVEKVTDTENQLRGFESRAKSMIASRELAMIQLERAKLDLTRTEIVAPFSGVVIANHVEQNSSIAIGAMVATIEDTSKAEVRCNLRSDEMEFIYDSTPVEKNDSGSSTSIDLTSSPKNPTSSPEQTNNAHAYQLPAVPVTIQYERAGQMFHWKGMLSRQDGLGVDQNTRTMPVRILVDNPTDNIIEVANPGDASPATPERALALVRGMFVKVKLHCRPKMQLMTISESVLRPGKNVWVMRDEKLHIEPIRIARIEGGQVYFDPRYSSLSPTDQVISSPVPNAKQGLAVSLKSDRKKKGAAKNKDMPPETKAVTEQPEKSQPNNAAVLDPPAPPAPIDAADSTIAFKPTSQQ